uniref:Ferritin-like n=1 Tax=Schyzocotyle acheilognathi TaxID=135513 RepID=Q5VKI9_SCHAC|nr:ferritin-like [Schyzocotyle acheilognathi]
MESSRINFPVEVEKKVNELISAYIRAELAYYTLAGKAASDKATLLNTARYYQARAQQLNQTRTQMAHYQTFRGAIPQFNEDSMKSLQSAQKPQSAEEMRQEMKRAVEIEHELEEKLRELIEEAESRKDSVTVRFTEKQLYRFQTPLTKQVIRPYNHQQQAKCMIAFDEMTMRREAEEKLEEVHEYHQMKFKQNFPRQFCEKHWRLSQRQLFEQSNRGLQQ